MNARIDRWFARALGTSVAPIVCIFASGSIALAQPADAGTPAPTASATATPATATPPAADTTTPVADTAPPAPVDETTASTATEDGDSTTPEEETTDDFRDRWVALGLKVGLYVPSVVNDMGPHVDFGIEGTLLLPFIARRLGVMLEIGWSPPGASGSGDDPRLGDAGGRWTYEMTTQELFFALGPVVRFLPPGSTVVPYLGVLGRLYLLETSVEGTGGGQALGENTEHSTQFGVVFLGGGELRLGPGAALLEVSFGFSNLPHTITGDTSTGALAVELGYRLFL